MLPDADEPNRLFGQPEHEARKLRYLVSQGFERGNHTFWHADLSRYPEAIVRAQLARAQQRIEQIVPGYRLRTLALPMGNYPRQIDWAACFGPNIASYLTWLASFARIASCSRPFETTRPRSFASVGSR